MKKSSTIILRIAIALIGIGVLVFMIWEPHIEGRNVNATLFEIYFRDPFLAYVYLGSIPFFVALYQAFKALGYVGQNKTSSQTIVKAMRTIKYCALFTAGAVIVADVFLMIHARLNPELGAQDGPEGAIVLGVVATFGLIGIATSANLFERKIGDKHYKPIN